MHESEFFEKYTPSVSIPGDWSITDRGKACTANSQSGLNGGCKSPGFWKHWTGLFWEGGCTVGDGFPPVMEKVGTLIGCDNGRLRVPANSRNAAIKFKIVVTPSYGGWLTLLIGQRNVPVKVVLTDSKNWCVAGWVTFSTTF